jgi:threonine aldolase
VETDECGAPEFFSNGTKVLLLPGVNGKIDPPAIERMVKRRTDIHYPKPKVVSLTQATEVGTVYSPDEVRAVGRMAKKHGLEIFTVAVHLQRLLLVRGETFRRRPDDHSPGRTVHNESIAR